MVERTFVSVVDDDESVRESLPDLLRSFGFEVEAFAAAAEFLSSTALMRTGCLVLDVAMPGMTGPELQQELARRKLQIPIVFITAHSNDQTQPQVLAQGAVACLIKPFSEAEIVEAVKAGFAMA
jgi:FixJ family two-component response regulator